MKKIFTSLFISMGLFFSLDTNAQCVIDQTLSLGPDELVAVNPEDIGPFCQGVTVQQTVQIIAQRNVDFNGQAAVVNSVTINDILGLPDGFTFDPATACPAGTNCTFVANGNDSFIRGCISVSGTANGEFNDDITLDLTAAGSSGPFNVDVDTSATLGLEILPSSDARCVIQGLEGFNISEGFSIYPNPTNSVSTMNLSLPSSTNVNVGIFDLLGNRIDTAFNGWMAAGDNTVTLSSISSLNEGLYMLKVDIDTGNGINSYTERLIVE